MATATVLSAAVARDKQERSNAAMAYLILVAIELAWDNRPTTKSFHVAGVHFLGLRQRRVLLQRRQLQRPLRVLRWWIVPTRLAANVAVAAEPRMIGRCRTRVKLRR